MTREEEIYKIAKEYSENEYNEIDASNAFIAGAKYADENPKSPWISVDEDLPCYHQELIFLGGLIEGSETVEVFARNEHGDVWTDYMIYENNKWRWNDFEPAYWMIAPKLPK